MPSHPAFLSFIFFPLLPLLITGTPITPVEPTEPPCGSCLAASEIMPIAQRWLDVFSTDGLDGLDNTVTENVQYWNEEFTYPGSPTPYAGSRSELGDRIDESAKEWTACTDITFEIVSAWADCDRIAVRWRQRAVVSDSYKGPAKPGDPILFSGIDLVTVDLSSRMVSNAETSSDRLNYYAQLGQDPISN